MVTRPNAKRLSLVKRSIACYLRQTHARRELVIALDDGLEIDKAAIEAYVAILCRKDIRVIRAEGKPTLGRLRNFAIENARGNLAAVWDDDDIYHPRRLELQVQALRDSGAIATFLSDVLHLFVGTRQLFWTNYRNTVQKCLPGTGLFLRGVTSRYPESGPNSDRGEDTDFCLRLLEEGSVHFVDDAARLYMYVNHSGNTSGDDHHHMLARSLGVSRGRLLRRESEVRDALDHARTSLELDEVHVHGNNGPAFTWLTTSDQ
jgi:glycosyltransferase involved in cell wall biosynthesis